MRGEPPEELDGARVERFTPIDARHRPTGACRHSRGGKPVTAASGLAICRYAGESEVYLFRCDAGWTVLTDTLHETVARAVEQAEFEYAGSRGTWVTR